MADAAPRRRPSFVFPLLLVGVGIFLLLGEFDVLPDETWENLLFLWPVLLVLIGVDMIIRAVGQGWSAQVVRFVVALLVLGGAFVFAASPRWSRQLDFPRLPDAPFWELKSRNVRVPLDDAQRATLRVDFDDHGGEITALAADSGDLVRGDLRYYDRLRYDVERQGDRTTVTLGSRPRFPFVSIHSRSMTWQLGLSPGVPASLDLETGDRRVRIDLGGLDVEDLLLDAGDGSVELELPAEGLFEGRLDGDDGRITIRLPDTLALRVELDGGDGRFDVSAADRLTRRSGSGRDGIWETGGFAASTDRVTLRIDQGDGTVRIEAL